jgi:hypothetical protein
MTHSRSVPRLTQNQVSSLVLARPKQPVNQQIKPQTTPPPQSPTKPKPKLKSRPKPILLKKPKKEDHQAIQEKEQSRPFSYLAAGIVRGIYHSNEVDLRQGVLVCDDGTHYPATLDNRLLRIKLTKNPEWLTEPQFYYVYPKTFSSCPGVLMNIAAIRREREDLPFERLTELSDRFTIRGEVAFIERKSTRRDGYKQLTVQIRRNLDTPPGFEKAKRWQPFLLFLHFDGDVHIFKRKGLWEFCTRRDPHRGLVIESAKNFVPAPPLLKRRRHA